MRINVSSVRGKLTLWYTLALVLIVLAFSASVFFFVKDRFFRQFDRELGREFALIAGEIAEDSGDLAEIEPEGSPRIFTVFRGDKAAYMSAPFQKAGLAEIPPGQGAGVRTVRSQSGERFRLQTGTVKGGQVLVVAMDEEPVRKNLGSLLAILAFALPVALLLAAVGGYVLAGRMLAPVGAMARRARTIGAENLSERLPVANPDDELGRLASAFNQTLARLENAFERLRRFTADASHELRTPLTAIRSVGEVALQENLDAAAYRDRIGSMLEESARLTHLVESLLDLTRADSGRLLVNRKPCDLAALVGKAAEDMRILAEERDQTLTADLPTGARASVDEGLLRQAVVNILDNAIKYTPPGGSVSVALTDRPGVVVIEVADSGPGIPAAHREKIFDRFYRIERDRSRDAGGAGLGLAIARWAVEANGGAIEVLDRAPHGSVFRIVLPK
jgi:heavy metal sensor kinase